MDGVIILAAGMVDDSLFVEFGKISSAEIPTVSSCAILRKCQEFNFATPMIVTLSKDSEHLKKPLSQIAPQIHFVVPDSPIQIGEMVQLSMASAIAQGWKSCELHFVDSITKTKVKEDQILVQRRPDSYRWASILHLPTGSIDIKPKHSEAPYDMAIIGVFGCSDLIKFNECLTHQSLIDGRSGEPQFYQAWVRYSDKIKQVSVFEVSDWLDIGHIDGYFPARSALLQGRVFNSFEFNVDKNSILKFSSISKLDKNEVEWYRNWPTDLDDLIPKTSFDQNSSLEIEYIPSISLAESLIYCNLDLAYWDRSTSAIQSAFFRINDFSRREVMPDEFRFSRYAMFFEKPFNRLKPFRNLPWFRNFLSGSIRFNGKLLPNLTEVFEFIAEIFSKESSSPRKNLFSLMHGDFILGNMLYEMKMSRLFLIDPRGHYTSPGVWGDSLYDVCKLGHSILGRYDFLAHNMFHLSYDNESNWEFEIAKSQSCERTLKYLEDWYSKFIDNISFDRHEVYAGIASVLLSDISLHPEKQKRQESLLLNALNVASEVI